MLASAGIIQIIFIWGDETCSRFGGFVNYG